jgi:hypothetical protein
LERKAFSGILLAVLLLSMVVALGTVAPTAHASSAEWWNTSWNYRRSVTVVNPNSFDLIEYPTNITLDTQSLVSAGKMKPDGSDLRLLHNNVEIPFAIVDPNTANTKIVFKSSVPANGDDPNYMLYYGNPSASDVSVSYEKIFYEVIDEFNDGVIDPMWSFNEYVVSRYESDGYLYIEKGSTGGLAEAILITKNISNSEVLRVQFSSLSGEIGWAGYNGVHFYLIDPDDPGSRHISAFANTYFKESNDAAPRMSFVNTSSSSEISAYRIDWTQVNYQWYDYELYWNESSNFASMTMDDLYYDNENTNGWLEDLSFEFRFGANAYSPSGTSYARFDYIRIWQEVSKEPTTTVGAEETQFLTLTIMMTNNGSGKTETITLELIDEDHDGFITLDIHNRILAAVRRTHGTTIFDFPEEYTATKGAWTVTLSSSSDYTVTLT